MKGKFCWLAKEEKKGWALWFCIGEKLTFKVKGLWFKSEKSVNEALKGNIVFVERGNK